MVMHTRAAKELQALLHRMDTSLAGMEAIIPPEQQAINELDAEKVNRLTAERKRLWQELQQQKNLCQQLFLQHGMAADAEMSSFIDRHLTEDASALHEQRQALNERIIQVSRNNELNGIRFRAAAEAIAETLQGLGLLQAKTTYGRDGQL